MPEENTTATVLSPETTEYLRSLSQCAYDVKIIIDIHQAEKHLFLKILEHHYHLERRKLIKLLNNPIGITQFAFEQSFLTEYLIAGNNQTLEEKGETDLAIRNLSKLLSAINREREKGVNFKVSQGVEDGPLKNYLLNLTEDGGDKIYPESLIMGKDRLSGLKKSGKKFEPIKGKEIKILEILKDEENPKYLTVFVNHHYQNPVMILNKKYGKKLYELAQAQTIDLCTGFLDYLNTNDRNRLYTTGGYNVTKLAKQESDLIIPEADIKIALITQKKVTQIKNQTA